MKNLLKFTMTLAIMLLGTVVGFAQNTGQAPFVGSTHQYTVTPESTSNTLNWSIAPNDGNFSSSNALDGSNSVLTVTWGAGSSGTTYTITFTEEDATSNCIATRTITVTPADNDFDVSVPLVSAICNSATNSSTQGDVTTQIQFTVQMDNESATWNPNWEIEFDLSPNAAASITDLVPSAGTADWTTTGTPTGPFKLTAIPSSGATTTITLTMQVTGDANTLQEVQLEITSAKELDHNTPDKDEDDWIQTQTINAVPNTSAITTDN
ncbi:hypothetical protein EYV94_03270 [Puteibacter caeruleilacunae]|nr:hypothetical protein EYV94_03270 [Puteibacter caeruleilacunae]